MHRIIKKIYVIKSKLMGKGIQKSAINLFLTPVFLIIYNFAANLSNDIYLPALPGLVEELNTSRGYVQFTLTAWLMGVALPQIILGPISDRLGRRPLIMLGAGCFLLATAGCVLATNVWLLIVARFFQGAGVSSLNIASFSVVRELYDDTECTRYLAYMAMWGSLAPLLGPVIGGYVLIWLSWRANFILVFIIALMGIIGLWLILPESNEEPEMGGLRIATILSKYKYLILKRDYIRYVVCYSCLLGGVIAYIISSPFVIISRLHIGPEYYGIFQIPIFGAYIIGSLMVGCYVKYLGTNKVILVGLTLISISSGVLLMVSYFCQDSLLGFILPMTCYMLGFGLCSASLSTMAMSGHPRFMIGTAAALLGFSMACVGSFASLITGLIYNNSILSAAALIFLMVLLAILAFFKLEKPPGE